MTDPTRTHPTAANDGVTRTGVDLPTASEELGSGPFTASAPVEPTSPPPPFDPPPGFSVEAEIGSGGMGVVYRVRQRGLNRPVALKTVRPGVKLDAKAMIRFLAEAEAVAAVRHPNVVEVYSYGDHDGKPWLALEYCPGGDLTTLTKTDQTRDAAWFRKVADLMAGVADGVQAAHALSIVHRDLKPANVLLAADGTPKVSDFGLAKRGAGADLTQTQAVMGTPAYMSPEQASGGTKFVGPEADVWALGVMLYELACGERPIDTSGPQLEAIARVARAEVPPLRGKCPAVPKDLALIAHKCLTADPRDRYPTAGGLGNDLRDWLAGKPISARSVGTIELAVKWVKRNKRLAVMGGAVLFTMAAATGISLGFGLEANRQANNARDEKKKADDKSGELTAALDELGKSNEKVTAVLTDLQKMSEKTNRTLAKALLAPISANKYEAELGSYELNALWGLVAVRDGPVPLVLLEEATSGELAVAQFRNRAEFLDHAAVGLDSRKRREADDLFDRRLSDRTLPAELRRDLTLAKISAGRYDSDKALLDAITMADDVFEQRQFALDLADAAVWLPPDRAEKLCSQAAEELTKGLSRVRDGYERKALAEGLAAVARRLPVERAAAALEAGLEKVTDENERRVMATLCRRADRGWGDTRRLATNRQIADGLLVALGREPAPILYRQRELVDAVSGISERGRVHLLRRTVLAASVGFPPLLPTAHPNTRPLPSQQLVELLKHPLCVKETRRAVLDGLQFIHDRRFVDLWEFVAFAEKEYPELDLLTPPKRLERK